jgi:predicted metal-dependent hydrolase
LDAPPVAVRFVLFHEMLHMRHPTQYRPTRRCVHTPEFKRAERGFPQYKQAKAELKRFIEEAAQKSG